VVGASLRAVDTQPLAAQTSRKRVPHGRDATGFRSGGGGYSRSQRGDQAAEAGTAEAFNRIDAAHPELVSAAEVVSRVFDPNVFRVALTLIAVAYLIRGERHHATWLVVTVFGGAARGLALKEIVGRARPVLPDPASAAPGLSFPSGHALGASIACCLLLLITLRFLPRSGRVAAVIVAALIVGAVALGLRGLGWGPRVWPRGQRMGGWVIHCPRVVRTS
jgi:hypothetical protein